MAKIVQKSDFVGLYSITQNQFTATNLQAFIDKFEKVYLYDLLGITLADLFLADITTPFTPPVNTDYLVIFNPLQIGNYCGNDKSLGIKDMLTAFIYWEFVKQQPVVNTITGPVNAQNEVSQLVDYTNTIIYSVYNEGVKSFNTIQWYIRDNYNVYSDFKGSHKHLTHWSI